MHSVSKSGVLLGPTSAYLSSVEERERERVCVGGCVLVHVHECMYTEIVFLVPLIIWVFCVYYSCGVTVVLYCDELRALYRNWLSLVICHEVTGTCNYAGRCTVRGYCI